MTESFIKRWLQNDNGTFATYLKDEGPEDIDLVKGRETLSETLGLWMEYVLQKGDQEAFETAVRQLHRYFLEENGFVHWKLTEKGASEVSTNALVDDLRIIHALLQAGEKWGSPRYEETAALIAGYITHHNNNQGVLTDYYEKKDRYASDVITLSYIEPNALEKMKDRGLIDDNVYYNMRTILQLAPIDKVFYPKSYDVKRNKYMFDNDINMIDQALVALYRARAGFATEHFLEFLKRELRQNGIIYGQYNRTSKKPIVAYESPAIYGWLVLYALEEEEEELAKKLFAQMTTFRNTRKHAKYVGGYSIYQNNTHIFDNLVPLLTERAMFDGVILPPRKEEKR